MSARDPRYDILFEPVKIGPVTAKNRFYQVPHCTGQGHLHPVMVASLRGMKAEGGWGVINTEYCSIHHTSDDLPYPSATLWNNADVRANALMTEKVHEHGALAGVELWYGGNRTANLYSREISYDVDSIPNSSGDPIQTKSMDKTDIKNFRLWHRKAALRAKAAGFDIVYVYATHGYMLSNFLSEKTNTRTDEYGGSVENRVRLIRELIEDTKDAVGDTCGVACRFSLDEGGGGDGNPRSETPREMFEILAELPDLWDINMGDYSYEMGHSRFVKEASLEPYMSFVKSMTTKPVVTVGRFTSPDTMVSQVKRGIVDMIGAARPSIADPFLPKKIEEGRPEDIRECIGCNVCYTGDGKSVPIRCTQNPTMSEEWRRGWHPEIVPPKGSDSSVLVIGGGPAGLEATRALGQRGYNVTLAEASNELGGRVTRESQLPGLIEWARVRDYRVQQIQQMVNVEVYLESKLDAEQVLEFEADHILLATGATWLRTGRGRFNPQGLKNPGPNAQVFTPDDIMAGRLPTGRVVIFDDDHYYMGSVLAERLRAEDLDVTLLTPGDKAGTWGGYTSEQTRNQTRLLELDVEIITAHGLSGFDGKAATIACAYTGREKTIPADSVVMVTMRSPNDELYTELSALMEGGTATLQRAGDCLAPGIIATATYAGHRYARELDEPENDRDVPFRREVFVLDGD